MYKIKEEPKDFIVNEISELTLNKEGTFSYFKLKKKNTNTESAIDKIAEILRIHKNNIKYSGAKDKVAITTQYISIENLKGPQRKNFEIDQIELEYIGQGNEPLSLGTHSENEFIITVKEAENNPRENFNQSRIPNLFGPQRFSKNNHIIGKHLIKKEFKLAVKEILTNSGNQEDKIRDYLFNNETDFVGALRTMSKKILSLYVHAYQSQLFNEMVELHLKNNPESNNIELPLIGFSTKTEDYPNYIVDDILDKEEIDTRDFIIKQIPDLSCEGDKRNIFMEVKNLNFEELDKNSYKISFILGKGSYATVLIDYLFNYWWIQNKYQSFTSFLKFIFFKNSIEYIPNAKSIIPITKNIDFEP